MAALITAVAFSLQPATDRLRLRLEREEGQTAAEWLGIVVVVAAIIAALFTADIPSKIGGYVADLVDDIFNGGRAVD